MVGWYCGHVPYTHSVGCTLNFFLELVLISFQICSFFFKVHLRQKNFKNLRPHFQQSFVPNFFFILSVLGSRIEHKKFLENRTAVYFSLHHEFYKFLSIFGHFCCFAVHFLIFLQCFSLSFYCNPGSAPLHT